jgi:DNA-directed RNA polymerase specialized sigma24 family protein
VTSDGRRKEALYDPLIPTIGGSRHASAFGRAFSPTEALISCAPPEEPEESVLEQLALREALADALDTLEEDDRWLFDMLIVVRLSLRFVGRVIGMPKTTVARRRDKIIADLRDILNDDPVVQERLGQWWFSPEDRAVLLPRSK